MDKAVETGIKEISWKEMEGVRIGNAQNRDAMTGVTALVFDAPAVTGIDISGGGPASRETPLLDPKMACESLDAVLLSGGSAFGLEAGTGAMKYLEEQGRGVETGYAKVPLVCQSCIYDLGMGCSQIRPDAQMGYAACVNAEKNEAVCGNAGAGTGATVGKLAGIRQGMKSGLGTYAVQLGDLKVAAVVAVNAVGDVFDWETGEKLAGMRTADRKAFADSETAMYQGHLLYSAHAGNTTIGAVITNAAFTKAQMTKVASMTRNAYARCISPVGTMADGDAIYAVSVGQVKADINIVGTLSSRVMAEAIRRAVVTAQIPEEEYLRKCL